MYHQVGCFRNPSNEGVVARYIYDSDDKTIEVVTDEEYSTLIQSGVVIKDSIKPSSLISNNLKIHSIPKFIGSFRVNNQDFAHVQYTFMLGYLDDSLGVSFKGEDPEIQLIDTEFCFKTPDGEGSYILVIGNHYIDCPDYPKICDYMFAGSYDSDYPQQKDYPYEMFYGSVYGFPIPSIFARYLLDLHKRCSNSELLSLCSRGILERAYHGHYPLVQNNILNRKDIQFNWTGKKNDYN